MDDDLSGWRKSTYCGGSFSCAEVAAWRVSSQCQTGECVEVGQDTAVVAVRDTKLADSPVLVFPASAWRTAMARLKADAGVAH